MLNPLPSAGAECAVNWNEELPPDGVRWRGGESDPELEPEDEEEKWRPAVLTEDAAAVRAARSNSSEGGEELTAYPCSASLSLLSKYSAACKSAAMLILLERILPWAVYFFLFFQIGKRRGKLFICTVSGLVYILYFYISASACELPTLINCYVTQILN